MILKLFELYKHVNNRDVGLAPLTLLSDDRQLSRVRYHAMWFNLTGKEPRALAYDTVEIRYDDHRKWRKLSTKPYLKLVH